MMKRNAAIILLILLLSIVANAQNRTSIKRSIPKTYWLNHSLIFIFGCQPKVYPNNIIFTEGHCSTDANAIYHSQILVRGTKVEVRSIVREKGFAKLSFTQGATDYEILLKNNSEISFRTSFNLLFSEKELRAGYKICPTIRRGLRTKQDVIKCMGFPIKATKVGDVEEYFYIIEFVGFDYYGYDGYTVSIKNSRVINVSGNI